MRSSLAAWRVTALRSTRNRGANSSLSTRARSSAATSTQASSSSTKQVRANAGAPGSRRRWWPLEGFVVVEGHFE